MHTHTIPLPVPYAQVELWLKGERPKRYNPFMVSIEVKAEGLYIKHYDECRNPTVANFYPIHLVIRLSQDYITDEDNEKFEQWYADAHVGLTPEEEDKAELRHEIAKRFGIDPDEIDFL